MFFFMEMWSSAPCHNPLPWRTMVSPFVCQLHWIQSGMDDPTNNWVAASTVLSSLMQASLSPGKNMHSKRQGYH